MLKAPAITDQHKAAHLSWAKDHLVRGASFWKRIIFSDEKRWTLDGPDGLACYWKAADRSPRWFAQRKLGVGGLMFWPGFSAGGKLELDVVVGGLGADAYIELL